MNGWGWALYTCTWLAMEQREWVGVGGVGTVYNYMYMARISNGAEGMGGGGHCIHVHG